MKKTIKGFILGVIITALFTGTVLGSGLMKTIEVGFNTVNLTVNGKKVSADNILYDGTTYVPLRATAEILGKEVGWDGATRTASINDKKSEVPGDKEGGTVSQKNAVKSAKSYLEYGSFSRSGLIKQLEYVSPRERCVD